MWPPASASAAGEPSRSAIVGGTVAGHHLLDIDGYSHTKQIPTGQFIKLHPFHVGGHSWCICYYPSGRCLGTAQHIVVHLVPDKLVAEPVMARAKFSLLDLAGKPVSAHTRNTKIHDFATDGYGFTRFVKWTWLEKSNYLKDDRFTIKCDVVVTMGLCIEERKAMSPLVVVPPSNLHGHLGDLLASEEGADITLQVAGETFRAHKCVLAARSPVFKLDLLGKMKASNNVVVVSVDDMEAKVFWALLCFLYTDALPEYLESTKKEQAAMVQHWLVTADRYGLERMKLVCEDRLCNHIDLGSVVNILVLAEQHHCLGLKEVCFPFLSSPSNLNEVMEGDHFEHLTRSCPSVLKELLSNIAARGLFEGE